MRGQLHACASEMLDRSRGQITAVAGAESAALSGCAAGAVFFDDVSQHFMFAQHAGRQAVMLAAFTRMQVRADIGSEETLKIASNRMERPRAIATYLA